MNTQTNDQFSGLNMGVSQHPNANNFGNNQVRSPTANPSLPLQGFNNDNEK